MKIAAVCVTWNRPRELGKMIRCFERQDHAERELVILDDAGQYEPVEGPGWRLISVSKRFPTLGEKRNAAIRLVSPDVEALAVWDDDDLYLPWALSATVAALQIAPLSRPGIVLHPDIGGHLYQHETNGLFHSGWGYRRDAFDSVDGYPAANNGEDQRLLSRFAAAEIATADPIALGYRPFLVYPWGMVGTSHLSGSGPHGYAIRGANEIEPTNILGWIAEPAVELDNPIIVPGVKPRKF